MNRQIDNIQRQLMLAKQFGIEPITFKEQWQAFLLANSPRQLQLAKERLLSNGLKEVQVSQKPLKKNLEETKSSLLSIGKIDYRA
jgi:hypothetical protein